ncbi:DUF3106 domain-containing protein [Piscinibacter sp. XHJ-5]|uniref:DUF3106 domain-containing protein n=1 Tax=Piscinibacter sp. XHJ-5 TaxID=3037797 RepID=UPI0024530655|nr:DUF3106 domain-containing protein [Piscinibacter sp. XHJ-5]
MRPGGFSFAHLRLGLLAGSLAACLAAAAPVAWAQASPVPAKRAEVGPRWSELTPGQRSALKPLERDWASIEGDRKQKWLDIAARMPSMPPAERERVQARMNEWARLSPQQRGQARMAYQEAKQVAPQDRQARWEAYQALSAEQKRQLQAQAARPVPPATPKPQVPAPPRTNDRADRPQAKSNIVPNPAFAAPPKAVAPTVVQAQPGATTNLMSKRPVPPAHQQTGLPKIAATPGFVDKTTLLPQRGPQGAATSSAGAPGNDQRP